MTFYKSAQMNNEATALYERLQAMYEFMQNAIDTQEVENAIFEYEDCVTEEDYKNWVRKYSFFM